MTNTFAYLPLQGWKLPGGRDHALRVEDGSSSALFALVWAEAGGLLLNLDCELLGGRDYRFLVLYFTCLVHCRGSVSVD